MATTLCKLLTIQQRDSATKRRLDYFYSCLVKLGNTKFLPGSPLFLANVYLPPNALHADEQSLHFRPKLISQLYPSLQSTRLLVPNNFSRSKFSSGSSLSTFTKRITLAYLTCPFLGCDFSSTCHVRSSADGLHVGFQGARLHLLNAPRSLPRTRGKLLYRSCCGRCCKAECRLNVHM